MRPTIAARAAALEQDPIRAILAAQEPELLASMVAIWWEEARKYQVFPMDASVAARIVETILRG